MGSAPWRIASASAVGTSHLANGVPCQDSARHALITTGEGIVLVSVVCDGAGSAPHSEVGSRVAAQTFVEFVERYFDAGGRLADVDRRQALSWIFEASHAIEATARDNGAAQRDYACTLVGAVVGPQAAAFVQVGDGAIVVRSGEDGGWSHVFWPQHGEFANTTNFIVSPGVRHTMDFDLTLHRVDEFAMFSDGIEKLVLHDATQTVHDPFFDAMFPPVRTSAGEGVDAKLSEGLAAYLASPRVCARTDDDKTLVLATRRKIDARQAADENAAHTT